MNPLKYTLLIFISLICSAVGFADDIFSTTYGEKWVTIQGVGVTGRYAYVSNYAIKHGTISDTSNPGDEYLWCLVQSGSNIYIYNKSLGNGYQPSISSSTTSSITIGSSNSNTFTVSTYSYTKSSTTYSGYYIKPTSYSQYWSLYGGESWSTDYPSAVVGYWNSMDHNCLWNIEVYDPTSTDNSDAGSSVSKDGYQLVFSSETADLASKYLTSLTDTEKEKCSGSFVDQDALETKWDYCTKGTAVWKSRMGTTEAEQRQMQGFSNETLNMYAKQVTSASDGTSKFLTSGIQTKDYYKYGIFEIKAKCTAHTSNFPAIWIMPEDHASDDVYDVPWPACGECDIMEQIGTSSTAHGTVHTGIRYNTFGKSYTTSSSKSLTDGAYHIYTLVWDESSLTWYYDGTQLWQYNKDTSLSEELQYQQFPYNKPYRIILDQAVGQNSSWGSEDPDASYTYDMDVAYVRVFQKTAGYTDPDCSFQNVTVDKTYQIKASTGQVLAAASTSSGATVSGATANITDALQQWLVKGSAASGYYFHLSNTSYCMQNSTSSVSTAAEEWSTNQCADGAQEAQTFYYTSDNKLYTLLNDNSSTKYYLVLNSTGTLSTTTSATSATTFTFVSPTTTYTVTCNQATGGTISATPTSATEGETITLSNTPNSGYTFGEYTVTDASGNAVTVNYDGTFTMPASDVIVTAIFEDKTLSLTDANPTLTAGTYKAGKVTYTRIGSYVIDGNYSSFCLPFDFNVNDVSCFNKVYTPIDVAFYNTSTDLLQIFLVNQTGIIKAGTPFLARLTGEEIKLSNENSVTYVGTASNPDVEELTVFNKNGTLSALTSNETIKLYWGGTLTLTSAKDGMNTFNLNGSFGPSSSELNPFRAYLIELDKTNSTKLHDIVVVFDEEDPTGISNLINPVQLNVDVYGINGMILRRNVNAQHAMDGLNPGLYVVNGSKVLKK